MSVGLDVQWHNVGMTGELAIIKGRELITLANKGTEFMQLTQAECSLQIGHPVIKAQDLLLIVPGTMAGFGQFRRIGSNSVTT